jgi:class 3 adenylate cyclase
VSFLSSFRNHAHESPYGIETRRLTFSSAPVSRQQPATLAASFSFIEHPYTAGPPLGKSRGGEIQVRSFSVPPFSAALAHPIFWRMSETEALFAALRDATDPDVADAVEQLVRQAPDHALCRINALDFASGSNLGEERVIAGLLHATRLGLFDLLWNILCPSCGGVIDTNVSLKTVTRPEYRCAFCAAGYEPILDDVVEVTFTVNPRLREIAAHHPETLPLLDYYRQIFWSSGIDLPSHEMLPQIMDEVTLETVELPAGDKAILSLALPLGMAIVFDPVTHCAQFIEVKGERTRERQSVTMLLDRSAATPAMATLRPGPLRLNIENREQTRALPGVWIAGPALEQLLSRKKPFLTAKRLLTNQTFRDIYHADTLDVEQRLKITSLTFLFTDLKGSTELYERVGDLVAYDLVRAHFRVLTEIVAAEAGAVVKTIGDAVMATFPTPNRAIAAALRMREAMLSLNEERTRDDDLLLKIGIHEGPCLAVMLNERQDYFGQTVNIASRVQHLASSQAIYATGSVVGHKATADLLAKADVLPIVQRQTLRGVADHVSVYELP